MPLLRKYTYKWGGSKTTKGSCKPDTNSGYDTDDSNVLPSRRLSSYPHSITAEIMLGVQNAPNNTMDCKKGKKSSKACETINGQLLWLTGEAMCKMFTDNDYYKNNVDDYYDDDKPTTLPTSMPSAPTSSPSVSQVPTTFTFSPTLSVSPTTVMPSPLPTSEPTPVPTPSFLPTEKPTPTPTAYPTNPDVSAYCVTAKFTCEIDFEHQVFPLAKSWRWNVFDATYYMFQGMRTYYANTVNKQLAAFGTTGSVNWWSDLKVKTTGCTYHDNGNYEELTGRNVDVDESVCGLMGEKDTDDGLSDTDISLIVIFTILGTCVIFCYCLYKFKPSVFSCDGCCNFSCFGGNNDNAGHSHEGKNQAGDFRDPNLDPSMVKAGEVDLET